MISMTMITTTQQVSFITDFIYTKVQLRVALVEQEPTIPPEHPSSPGF